MKTPPFDTALHREGTADGPPATRTRLPGPRAWRNVIPPCAAALTTLTALVVMWVLP